MVQTPPAAPRASAGDPRPQVAGRPGSTTLRMPRWTDRGPYRLDLDRMLDQARTAVLARPELLTQRELLQDPPDLAAIIAEQRGLILAGVPGLESRANSTAFRLRDLLFASLVSDPDDGDRAAFLAGSIGWLGSTIDSLDTWDQAPPDQLTAEDRVPAGDVLQKIGQTRALVADTWLRHYHGNARQFAAVAAEPNMVSHISVPPVQFITSPAGRLMVLQRELALCRALDSDMRTELELKLVRQVTTAREQSEYRALETEWESQQREVQATLEKAVLSAALTALNEAVVAATAPRMHAASLDGLRSALTDDKVVVTEAFDQLAGMLRQRSEGSFGVAGPRGVGKTTLIRFLANGPGLAPRGSADDGGPAAAKPRLGVVVSAPVRYQARDFVLYLYAELCKKVAGPDANEALLDKVRDLDREVKPTGLLGWQAWMAAIAILGAGALAGGAVLLGWAVRHAVGAAVQVMAWVGAGLLASAALVLLAVLWRLLGRLFRISVGSVTFSSIDVGPALAGDGEPVIPSDGPLRASRVLPRRAVWYVQYIAAAIVSGIALVITGGGWPGGSWSLVAGIALLTVGLGCLRGSARAGRMAPWGGFELLGGPFSLTLQEGSRLSGARLRELALETLLQIRVQQSFASERTRAVKATGASVLPVGFEIDVKRGVTWEEREKTYPELVADVKTFLSAVAEEYEVVIGIDELDKLRTADSVEDFLNDIKGIFGVPGCYYLVSVSEDAAAGFERRGAPFRDVFDSAFDDVISLRPLELVSARKILHGLLLGWTEPFIGLCFALSGGLPRDLWRVAHDLVAQRDDGNEIELGHAALALCCREGEGRLRAVRYELTRDPLDPDNAALLRLLADLSFAGATVGDMLRWHHDLLSWDTAQTPRATPAARLALETAAYLLLAATVLQFFVPELIADRLSSSDTRAKSAQALAAFASSRQSLALNPASALAATEHVRAEWGL